MAKAKKGKGARGGGAGSRQGDMADESGAAGAGSMQSDAGSMGGEAGSRQSALPEVDLPIQSGGERIGVGHHRQGRQTGGLHQPSIADELAAESAPDQGRAGRENKGKG